MQKTKQVKISRETFGWVQTEQVKISRETVGWIIVMIIV